MESNLSVYLEVQKPIKYNNILIHQPTLGDILEYDIDKYNTLLLPFLLDIDDLGIPEEEEYLIKDITIFEVLTSNDTTMPMLLNGIDYFCKPKNISFDEQKGILYIDDGYIDKLNFAEFSNIILKINSKHKQKKEKPPVNMTEKQRDIWEKLQAGRARARIKEQIYLSDLINICQFGGGYYIPKQEILNWTMFNISRCYQNIVGISNYNDAFGVYCVTGENELIKRHWTDLIKIDNNKEEEIL